MRSSPCPIAAAVLVAIALSACSDKNAAEAPPRSADVAAPAAAPLPPRQTETERMAQALANIGGTQSGDSVQLVLAGDRFKAGSARFEPGDKIATVAAVLNDHPGARVTIEGYTDDRGGTALNQRLSTERARAVRQALVERGVDASRIEATGRGSAQPVASNDTVEGRAQNRRVELTFVADASRRVAEADSSQPEAAQ